MLPCHELKELTIPSDTSQFFSCTTKSCATSVMLKPEGKKVWKHFTWVLLFNKTKGFYLYLEFLL